MGYLAGNLGRQLKRKVLNTGKMDPAADIDQRQREIQREYLDFLDDGVRERVVSVTSANL